MDETNERILATIEERTRNISADVAEIKSDVKELRRVGSDHEKRIASMEEWQKRHDESAKQTGSDLRSIIMPILTQGLSVGIAALLMVVIGHALGILH